MTVRIAVVYYSATGDVHHLAEAIAEGATTAGAEVRLRRGAQLARRSTPTPPGATMAPPLPPLSLKQPLAPWHGRTRMPWAPSRFGDVAAQLKQFVDQPAVLALTGSSALRRRHARRGQHRRLPRGSAPSRPAPAEFGEPGRCCAHGYGPDGIAVPDGPVSPFGLVLGRRSCSPARDHQGSDGDRCCRQGASSAVGERRPSAGSGL